MIIAIADDITGAAEIGGIGLCYGLKVILSDEARPYDCDLLVIYTNTRSLSEEEAINISLVVAEQVSRLQPTFIYKKTDSVLRGHVVAELRSLQRSFQLKRALLVPANPGMGRTIRQGTYYVNETPLDQTGFRHDPEFPLTTSDVQSILRAKKDEVIVVPVHNALPQEGIVLGETTSVEEMNFWAATDDQDILFAGGGAFFDALLRKRFAVRKERPCPSTSSFPLLFISGTTFLKNRQRFSTDDPRISSMPPGLMEAPVVNEVLLSTWQQQVLQRLEQYQMAFMVMGGPVNNIADPAQLRERLAKAAAGVVQQGQIRELIIEGGSTAYAILQQLGWSSFEPTCSWKQGVVRMKVTGGQDVFLTIKPGSYDWPSQWNFFESPQPVL